VPIVGAFDVHRRQITFEYADTDTGQLRRGRLADPHRRRLAEWLAAEFDQAEDVVFALEGCTGWRYVSEELARAGVEAHLADPAETQRRRGRKRRAKTDWADVRLQRELLARAELPESWIPPAHVLEMRALVALYKALRDERAAWQQRIQAVLFHQGVPEVGWLLRPAVRAFLLSDAELSPVGRRQVAVGYDLIDNLNAEMVDVRNTLGRFARRQPGCQALMANHYGVGPIVSVAVWTQLGDCSRFTNSSQVVRHSGLDITVYQSDDHRAPGFISRQGAPLLRWALYEAGQSAAKKASPDHAYYCTVKARHDGIRAALAVGRKLARRCYHTLRNLGPHALDPVA
jgi:transposase